LHVTYGAGNDLPEVLDPWRTNY